MALFRDSDIRDHLLSFLKSVPNSVTTCYSSELSISPTYAAVPLFDVVLKLSRMRAMEESDGRSSTLESSRTFRIAVKDFLEVVRVLAACPAWTHAKFLLPHHPPFSHDNFVPGSEDLMFELFSLLRASLSLSCLHIQNLRFCHKHLPTLLYENACLETLTLGFGTVNFAENAKSLALCLSRNSVLKSCKITCDAPAGCSRDLLSSDREWPALLFRPFTTEANVNLKELVLHLPAYACPVSNCADAVANLVRCNTTLEKLEIRHSTSQINDGLYKYDIGRALEVNHTLKELTSFCDLPGLAGIAAALVPDLSGRQLNTTLSTLNLFLLHVYDESDLEKDEGPVIRDEVAMMLNALASMLESNTTLKHVELTHKWFRRSSWRIPVLGLWNPRAVACRIQEKLKSMLGNELRLNTTLESLVFGFWTLLRIGTEWQMRYEGPCLNELRGPTEEYVVKVKIHADGAQSPCF